jgi:hypothetical protein
VSVIITIFMLIMILPVSAQDEDFLVDDDPRAVTLDGDNAAILQFIGTAGETIRLTVTHDPDAPEDPLNDPVVAVFAPGWRPLAYNDDNNTEDLAPQDAHIASLTLPQDGLYIVYVNTYGGIYAGTLTVTLDVLDLFDLRVDDDTDDLTVLRLTLPPERTFTYNFATQAGETITLTAQDAGRTLDPVLRVVDADGRVVAMNDDHPGDDLTLDAFDAQLRDLTLPPDEYTLQIADFLGQAGELIVTIEIKGCGYFAF